MVQVAVVHRDARPSPGAEGLLQVGAAVAVGVAQGDDARLAGLHVDIAGRAHGDVAQGPEGVGEHDRMEPGRQLDAAVVRIGLRGRQAR